VSDDIAIHVRLANEAVKRAGRRVDYVHMPVMPDAGEAFPPLEEPRSAPRSRSSGSF
jgi:hypothetical protein